MLLTYKEVEQYRRDGFILVEDVFTAKEIGTMVSDIEGGGRTAASAMSVNDESGKKAKLAYWEELADDVWSAASTSSRVVNNVRMLLGEEASFFHGKVMMKEARTGGAWEWHQDYGYWYDQGFLFPHMISAFVAIDPATKLNGCLRVLKGSHKMGRLTHLRVGGQTAADPARIAEAEKLFETVYCEMKPGSALFFDCNLLHCSASNDSDHHRRSFIMCYSAWGNPQMAKDGKPVLREPCPISGKRGDTSS
ncbi:phytanoyl-CoA dioxygenase family protein [Paenibacillus sp. MBLB4367]|uniref:phytanoyl-CoA dioxygenase family protein n=1 Tax=Paenibacillus sp. MBLB4367 TaxID=3384767 RepID=UPI0039080158